MPLDWIEPLDEDRVVLAIIRAPAKSRKDYRGPIFVNPGVSRDSSIQIPTPFKLTCSEGSRWIGRLLARGRNR